MSRSIFEANFKDINFSVVGLYDVLIYDGPHSEKDQYNVIRYPFPALRDDCIVLVDDWNWEGVRSGTKRAFDDLGVEVYAIQLRASQIPGTPDPFKDIPGGAGGLSNWHNGFFAAVVKKHGTETDLSFIQ